MVKIKMLIKNDKFPIISGRKNIKNKLKYNYNNRGGNKMEFNQNLIKLRKAKGLSQEQLGFELNVTRQTVSKWELGLTTPEMEKLTQIAKLFNLTVDDLLKNENVQESTSKEQEQNNKPREYLNEKKYKKNRKTLNIIAICIILGGIILGLLFIVSGSKSTEKNSTDNEQQIDNLDKQINELENKEKKLDKLQKEYFSNMDYDKYREAIFEISEIKKEIASLESEKMQLSAQDARQSVTSNFKVQGTKMFKIFAGVSIILISVPIALIILVIANRRTITAYTVQSTMPIAKEGMEELAPSVGKVAKEVAKEFKE